MKTLIISLMLFSISMPKSTIEYILIEHTGICDKPILTIIISKKAIAFDRQDLNYLLKPKCYGIVKDSITDFCYSMKSTKSSKYGTFTVSICGRDNKKIAFGIDRKNANLLFRKLISIVKKSNVNLAAQLESYCNRINY